MTAGALASHFILWSSPLAYAAVTGCAVVQKAPDGFGHLRKAPTNSEVVAQLKKEISCLSIRPDARRDAVLQFATKAIRVNGLTSRQFGEST